MHRENKISAEKYFQRHEEIPKEIQDILDYIRNVNDHEGNKELRKDPTYRISEQDQFFLNLAQKKIDELREELANTQVNLGGKIKKTKRRRDSKRRR